MLRLLSVMKAAALLDCSANTAVLLLCCPIPLEQRFGPPTWAYVAARGIPQKACIVLPDGLIQWVLGGTVIIQEQLRIPYPSPACLSHILWMVNL